MRWQWLSEPEPPKVQVNARTVQIGDTIQIGSEPRVVVGLRSNPGGVRTVLLDSGDALILHGRSQIDAIRAEQGGVLW